MSKTFIQQKTVEMIEDIEHRYIMRDWRSRVIIFYTRRMYKLWSLYHKFWLHKGRYGLSEWLICNHQNPYDRAYIHLRAALKKARKAKVQDLL